MQDRFTLSTVLRNPVLAITAIRHSHLNRLTNITPRELTVENLKTERDYAVMEMFTDEEAYDSGAWFLISSNIRNEQLALHDSVKGWKLRQMQTKPRELTIDETGGKAKEKKFLGLF